MTVLQRVSGLTSAGLGVLLAAIFGIGIGRSLGSRPLLLLAYGAVAVVLLARLLALRALDVTAQRSTLPTRMRVHQAVDVELVVTARRRLSTVVLEERLEGPFGTTVHIPIATLPPGAEMTHSYRLAARLRGVHSVGPLVVQWSDPFGLTRRESVLLGAETVVVHPLTEGVHDRVTTREWEDPPVRPPRSKPWPDGFEFAGLREYVAGDDPRRISWLATARSGGDRYLVRESEQGITDRIRLLLDTDSRHHARVGRDGEGTDTFERAVGVCASLGTRHLTDGFSVGLDANSRALTGPLRGRGARIPLLDQLAAVATEHVPLTTALQRLSVDPRRNAHHVLITPYLDEPAARWIRVLHERGTAFLLVLVLPEDPEPAALHRAAGLGCPVVELPPGAPLDRPFRHLVGAGR